MRSPQKQAQIEIGLQLIFNQIAASLLCVCPFRQWQCVTAIEVKTNGNHCSTYLLTRKSTEFWHLSRCSQCFEQLHWTAVTSAPSYPFSFWQSLLRLVQCSRLSPSSAWPASLHELICLSKMQASPSRSQAASIVVHSLSETHSWFLRTAQSSRAADISAQNHRTLRLEDWYIVLFTKYIDNQSSPFPIHNSIHINHETPKLYRQPFEITPLQKQLFGFLTSPKITEFSDRTWRRPDLIYYN